MASKAKKVKKTGKAKAAVRSSSTAKKHAPAKQRPVSRAKARVQVKGTAARTKSPHHAPGGRTDAHHATHRGAVGKAPAKIAVKVPRPEPVKLIFAEGDHVVYPTHGVGRVTGIESAEIAGM